MAVASPRGRWSTSPSSVLAAIPNFSSHTATPSAGLVTDGKIAAPLTEGADDIRKLVRRSTKPPHAKKRDAVPGLRLPRLDGASVDLVSLRGRRTLV